EEGVRARRDADRVLRAEERGELLLEGLDLGAHDEVAAREDALERGAELGGARVVLAPEVEERHGVDRLRGRGQGRLPGAAILRGRARRRDDEGPGELAEHGQPLEEAP